MRQRVHKIDEVSTIKELLERNHEKFSDLNAVKSKSKKEGKFDYISHGQLYDMITGLGTSLLDMGLANKKIAVIGENRYEWKVGYLAVSSGVGIVVPLDRALPENEILDLIKRSEVEAVIYSNTFDETMKKALKDDSNNLKYLISMDEKKNGDIKEKTKIVQENKTTIIKDIYKVYSQKELIDQGLKKIKKGDNSYSKRKIEPEDTACILFTSGTTSISKAVELTHKNLISNVLDIASTIEVRSDDTYLSFLPLHHTFECTTELLYSVYNGACVAYCTSLKSFAKDVKDYQVTAMVAVPILIETVYKKILRQAKKEGKDDKIKAGMKLSNLLMKFGVDIRKKLFEQIHEQLGGKLRLVVVGGAAFDKEVLKAFNSFGIATYQGYGLTETSPVVAAEDDKYRRPGTIGKEMPSLNVKIDSADEYGVGELLVQGPSVMKGYYNNPEENAKVFTDDGYFRTGDLATIDKDGFITITGRVKYVIVLRNGKNIYPEEIESLVNKIPGVEESMVYGIPDVDKEYVLGVKIVIDEIEFNKLLNKAFVEDKKETYYTKEQIDAYFKEQIKTKVNHKMPAYKYLKDIIVTTQPFEKTTTQKIRRNVEEKKILDEKNINQDGENHKKRIII